MKQADIISIIVGLSLAGLIWSAAGPPPTLAQAPAPTPQVNVPHFNGDIDLAQGVIFWFGQVNDTANYADVRLGYNDDELLVTLHIFDRRLWYDTSPAAVDLTGRDAVTLYLNLAGPTGETPSSDSYRLVSQLSHWQTRDNYQAVYRGNGSGWAPVALPFTTETNWRGNGPNDDQDDRGWLATFHLPFASFGLTGPPPAASGWGLGVALHDRDDAGGSAIPGQSWPAGIDYQRPSTWSRLNFGRLGYAPGLVRLGGVVTVRHGLNGAVVTDTHVGGHSDCAEPLSPNFFNAWGEANYAGYDQINIQNQWDVADWPCFSKYYVTFPLDDLPAGRPIISATLTMYQFGNAEPALAQPSLIHVLTVADDWTEATLTWNNAPPAMEEVAVTSVNPLLTFPGWPGAPVTWNVSRAVVQARAAGQPLRLALYSTDRPYHSGKYFSSSDAPDWNAAARPTLQVWWGDPLEVVGQLYLPLVIKAH